ncbi:MAG: DUF4366 domain-containing protein [Lachnospiraceae bacterium]|nr:DUF4366 domain-containing protein [Lachnospiraceae bacterium]
MKRFEDLVDVSKINALLKKEEEKEKTSNKVLWVLAIIGCVAAVIAIAYAVYTYLTPDFYDDFDDFDDDFDDDFFDDDEVVADKDEDDQAKED